MEENRQKGTENEPLVLDWDKLLPREVTDENPPPIVVVSSKTHGGGAKDSAAAMDTQMSDHELLERIRSSKNSLSLPAIATLPDKGEKLRLRLKWYEEELEKRNLQSQKVQTIKLEDESDEVEKPSRLTSSGDSEDFVRETTKPKDTKDGSFASFFNDKMDRDMCSSQKRDRTSNAFNKEISWLGPFDRQKHKRRFSGPSTQRETPPKRHQSFHRERGKKVLSNSNENGGFTSSTCPSKFRDKITNCFKTINHLSGYFYLPSNSKDTLPIFNSNGPRPKKEQTIVLVDEEEPQPVELLEELEKPDESMKDVRIYYPSRDHSECVEISYTDFDCLAPQAFLKSNIMNFYIRYLQLNVSPTSTVMHSCHFFNTYFYDKLKEILSHKGDSRDEFFIKFRRWWKGVNIFHKQYILIPINEDIHWSLVIICNPDKEEVSGPIILHLDSLGLHSSQSVFQNIKSFVVREWEHLCNDASSGSNHPFAKSVWENLSRRIVDSRITVPQQKNEYDCGLFVLYFMERFIEDAPKRLKKKDLGMFGKQWFRPEEASGLRTKLHKLLMAEFKKAQEANRNSFQSSPRSPSPSHDVLEV